MTRPFEGMPVYNLYGNLYACAFEAIMRLETPPCCASCGRMITSWDHVGVIFSAHSGPASHSRPDMTPAFSIVFHCRFVPVCHDQAMSGFAESLVKGASTNTGLITLDITPTVAAEDLPPNEPPTEDDDGNALDPENFRR